MLSRPASELPLIRDSLITTRRRTPRPPASALKRWEPGLLIGLAVLAVSASARAQSGPDLNMLAVQWVSGEFASPVMCEIEGETVRGIRRLTIEPHRDRDRRIVGLLRFIDMEADGAKRCFDTLGRPMPNLVGKLYMRIPGRSRPDTARRDFRHALERDKAFSFEVVRGALKVQPIALPPGEAKVQDLRRATVRVSLIAPASFADRELAPFRSPRKALLELNGRGELSLELPIFEAPSEPRAPR